MRQIKDVNMNFLPLVLILGLVYLGKNDNLRQLLPKLDIPSFAPLLKILGVDDKTISTLSSEAFSKLLEGDVDLRTVLPTAISLFSENSTKKPDGNNPSGDKAVGEETEFEITDNYFEPIKNAIPDDVSSDLSCFFN